MAPKAPTCAICDDSTLVPVDPAATVRVMTRCACWREAQHLQRVARAGIPPKYKHCTFDRFDAYTPVLTRALTRVRAFAEAFPAAPAHAGGKPGLFLQGLTGVGKSHLAIAALRLMLQRTAAPGVFYDVRDLLRLIRTSYNPMTRTTEEEVLRPVLTCGLLVLDDLGAEKTSEWVEETMNYIVNTRYGHCRATIFTTNYQDGPDDTDPHTLLGRIGFRMRSRIAEMCEFVDLDGADFRHLPPNFSARDLAESAKVRRAFLPTRGRPARASLRDPAGKELNWSGGRGGNS